MNKEDMSRIAGETDCPKGFKCCDAGAGKICKARDIGRETVLECLEKYPEECKFAVPFSKAYYCQCPLRVHIAKQIKE